MSGNKGGGERKKEYYAVGGSIPRREVNRLASHRRLESRKEVEKKKEALARCEYLESNNTKRKREETTKTRMGPEFSKSLEKVGDGQVI